MILISCNHVILIFILSELPPFDVIVASVYQVVAVLIWTGFVAIKPTDFAHRSFPYRMVAGGKQSESGIYFAIFNGMSSR